MKEKNKHKPSESNSEGFFKAFNDTENAVLFLFSLIYGTLYFELIGENHQYIL